jgi:hypothetical protein
MKDYIMVVNEDFEKMLDANPSDQHTRSIYADFIEERCEDINDIILVAGMRWLVKHDKCPYQLGGFWVFEQAPINWWHRKKPKNTLYGLVQGKMDEFVTRRAVEMELSLILHYTCALSLG